jgi:phosphate:Na+ symporter
LAFPVTLIDLAGFVALLLWGVHMVQTGIQRAFGARLRGLLGRAVRGRFRAFLAGLGVTAILQSSTATGLMVTGFAAGGLVDLVPALAVMLGANVGTTLIVQALSFNIAEVAPALILIGVLMFRRASGGPRDFGRVLIGLGLLLMALHGFLDLLTPYEDAPSLRLLLGAASTEPILDVILAAGLTWAAHSSVAVVLVVMSFAANGVVPPESAFALVLGANLGAAVNPVLEGGSNDPASRRLPIGNLCNRLVGTGVGLLALPYVGPWLMTVDPDASRAVANFHTLFNLVLAAVFFPVLGPFAGLLRRWLPDRVAQGDPSQPLYLDLSARETPIVALACATREALRLADVLEGMLQGFRDALERTDRRRIGETKRLDDVLDKLNRAIKAYLTSLDPEELGDADHRRLAAILAFITNLEQAGDIVDINLLGLVNKGLKRGVVFSGEERQALLAMVDRLIANARTAATLLLSGDQRVARALVAEKETFREMEAAATASHFARLRAGRIDAAETSTLHLDALGDLKQVNAHLVAAAAYPLLEQQGELLASRLRQEG